MTNDIVMLLMAEKRADRDGVEVQSSATGAVGFLGVGAWVGRVSRPRLCAIRRTRPLQPVANSKNIGRFWEVVLWLTGAAALAWGDLAAAGKLPPGSAPRVWPLQ